MPFSQMTASLALPPSWSQATFTHSLRRAVLGSTLLTTPRSPFRLRQSFSVWPHVLGSPRGLLCGTQAVIILRGILVSGILAIFPAHVFFFCGSMFKRNYRCMNLHS